MSKKSRLKSGFRIRKLSQTLLAVLGFFVSVLFLLPLNNPVLAAETVLFEDKFEDTDWASRGWYDSPDLEITSADHIQGSGHSCVWHWKKKGDRKPVGGHGRVLFTPTESVTLSFYIKFSTDWDWSGRSYHPHMLHFMTTENGPYDGGAFSHLTLYVEAVGGRPRLLIQDGQNMDQARAGENLVGVTEKRSVAGGNGDPDGYGGGHYKSGEMYWNGKGWGPDKIYFSDQPGPYYKNDWHHIKARFKLNSIVDGKGINDGVLQYWYDGELIMDYRDVLFRTGQHPTMKINQFLMLPYFGPGVPHEQRAWIDDLKITR
ncbi:MAG: hypothetical protein FVQ81_07850 [Candidatus Glassbacteria bacterium]|nr:hypothetical protein [Candidatus Glassbacteria bacterium]